LDLIEQLQSQRASFEHPSRQSAPAPSLFCRKTYGGLIRPAAEIDGRSGEASIAWA